MSGLFRRIFGKSPDQRVRACKRNVLKQQLQTRRTILRFERMEEEARQKAKYQAQKGKQAVAQSCVRQVIRLRKTIARMEKSCEQLQSIALTLEEQLVTLNAAKGAKQSVSIMKAMRKLHRMPEMAKVASDLSKEMLHAGLIEDALDDAMEALDDDEDLEEEAEAEFTTVMWEVTDGILGTMPEAPRAMSKSAAQMDAAAANDTLPVAAAAAHVPRLTISTEGGGGGGGVGGGEGGSSKTQDGHRNEK